MSKGISFRAGEKLRQALTERAQRQGKTVSELVREILEDAVVEPSLLERTRHVIGRLDFEVDDDVWRRQIHERNWRR